MLDKITLTFFREKHALYLGCGVQSAQSATELIISSKKMLDISAW